jgi:hypothetical protein
LFFYPPIYPPTDLRVGLVMELTVGCSRVEPDLKSEGRGLFLNRQTPTPTHPPPP